MTATTVIAPASSPVDVWTFARKLLRNRAILFGLGVLILLALVAVFASALWTVDPAALKPRLRNLLQVRDALAAQLFPQVAVAHMSSAECFRIDLAVSDENA